MILFLIDVPTPKKNKNSIISLDPSIVVIHVLVVGFNASKQVIRKQIKSLLHHIKKQDE
jgi:hypothetical protein